MIRFTLLLFSLFLASSSFAEAHAFLDHAEPGVGSANSASPSVVKIWFTGHLKTGLSTIQVLNAQGQEVDKHDVKIDSDDPSLMFVSVPKIAHGTYKVLWTAISIDTHTTHGSFTFTVASP